MTVVLVGGAFGAMLVEDDTSTVAFAGGEPLVEVELCVGEYEDLGEDEQVKR